MARIKRFRLFDWDGVDPERIFTLKLIMLAVMGGMVFSNITTGVAITSFLKELGATDFQYGLLIALVPMTNAFQFVVSYIMERNIDRVKLFITAGMIQRLIWIPIGLVPLFIPMSSSALRLWTIGLFMAVSAATYPVTNVTFYSMASDVVPERIRGRYFATRSRCATFAGFAVGLLSGWLLDVMPGWYGYMTVFFIAALLGGIDIACFFFMKIPPMKKSPAGESMLNMLTKVFRNRNYMRVCAYTTLWCFGVYLSSSFFNVYARTMLKLTNLDTMLIISVLSNLMAVIILPRWGRALDEYGSRPVLIVATVLNALVPLVWLLVLPGANNLYLAVIAQALSGLFWYGYELGAQNLFLGQSPTEGRSMYIAVYFIGTQLLGVALGNAAAGWLLDNPLAALERLNLAAGWFVPNRYTYLFALSALVRLLALFLILGVREEGSVGVGTMLKETSRHTRAAAGRLNARLRRRG